MAEEVHQELTSFLELRGGTAVPAEERVQPTQTNLLPSIRISLSIRSFQEGQAETV